MNQPGIIDNVSKYFGINIGKLLVGITDDEEDVPSRTALKRQAMLLVDSKSRRKGYRAPPKKR